MVEPPLEIILERIGDGVMALDPENRVTFANEEARNRVGPTLSVGAALADVYPRGVDPQLAAAIAQARRTAGAVTFTTLLSRRWLRVRVSPHAGSLIVSGHDITQLVHAREARERHVAEHEGLLRIATAVAEQVAPEEVFRLVAGELARLLHTEIGAVHRWHPASEEVEIVGVWSDGTTSVFDIGTRLPAGADTLIHPVLVDRTPVSFDHADAPFALPPGASGLAPVLGRDAVWGTVSVSTTRHDPFGAEALERLAHVAGLLSLAITNAEDRARLLEHARTDPLTELVNHRVFHERLATEFARAQRHGRRLSLILLDVDHFKEINDSLGHAVGDAVLADLARLLAQDAREEDLVGRVGGDEFALALPETTAAEAHAAVERLRDRVAATPVRDVWIRLSAGICDLAHAGSSQELYRLADGALYWCKAHGRDSSCVYEPDVMRVLPDSERAQRLQRSQALRGICAMARAIDAKDPCTCEHSERVAELAGLLAVEAGWDAPAVTLLQEAALVHDVGKIGVTDAVLLKPGRLSADEYEVVKVHAELGAQIVAEVLEPAQVAWIRGNHERPDGRGYPDGLSADQMPDGAALLAIADAWDAMVSDRPYSPALSCAAALAECRRCEAGQFTVGAVTALVGLARAGRFGALT